MINEGFILKKGVFLELLVLSKYYFFHEKFNKDDVKEMIHSFCSKYMVGYNRDMSSKFISKITTIAEKSSLKIIDSIPITSNELNAIRELNDMDEEKVAFIMLVLYKMNDYYAFSMSMDELFKLSTLRLNSSNRLKIIHSLTLKKKINSNTKLKRWVEFSDKEGSPEIYITDFERIVMHYLQWRGEPIVKCDGCGVLVKQSSNRRKYCETCWKEKERELKREWKRNRDKTLRK